MDAKYLRVGDVMVNIEQIVAVRLAGKDEDGDYVINLSGATQIGLNKKDGEALWEWMKAQSVTPLELAAF